VSLYYCELSLLFFIVALASIFGIGSHISIYYISLRKALHTLQHAGGADCLVAADKNHDVRASLRGFQEGDNLRVLRAKEDIVVSVNVQEIALSQRPVARYPGYALKMTWDVSEGKSMSRLSVNACWHEVVFKHEWRFTERTFLY
jgi:hypothetical protein